MRVFHLTDGDSGYVLQEDRRDEDGEMDLEEPSLVRIPLDPENARTFFKQVKGEDIRLIVGRFNLQREFVGRITGILLTRPADRYVSIGERDENFGTEYVDYGCFEIFRLRFKAKGQKVSIEATHCF
jgi:hypothetical protein